MTYTALYVLAVLVEFAIIRFVFGFIFYKVDPYSLDALVFLMIVYGVWGKYQLLADLQREQEVS